MLRMFTIHDAAANAFMRPFFAQASGSAIREFADLVNSDDHPIAAHPEDYALFSLGEFNEETGELVVENPPVSLGSAVTFRHYEPGTVADLKVADG